MTMGSEPQRQASMARKLDAAFAGCESWELVPPRRRAGEVGQPAGSAGRAVTEPSGRSAISAPRPTFSPIP